MIQSCMILRTLKLWESYGLGILHITGRFAGFARVVVPRYEANWGDPLKRTRVSA